MDNGFYRQCKQMPVKPYTCVFFRSFRMRMRNLWWPQMDLREYKELPRMIRCLATQYWLAVVLDRLGLDSLNQLSKEIANSGAIGAQQCSASFLYKKRKGCPISSTIKIQQIDKLVPGAYKCLTNPLWQLFSGQKIDEPFIRNQLSRLNQHVIATLFLPSTDMALPKRKGKVTASQVRSIERFNHPDALTCLLLLAMENKEKDPTIERSAYQVFIRLISFTPLHAVKNRLYALIYLYFFKKSDSQLKDPSITGYDEYLADEPGKRSYICFKKVFQPIPKDYLEEITNFYRSIANDLTEIQALEDDSNEKMLFNYLFDNSDRGWARAGIIALQTYSSEDHSNNVLPRIFKSMNYIKRVQ